MYIIHAHLYINMIDFLKEFCTLTHAEQRVFMFCLEHMPNVYKHTSDVRRICLCLGLSYKTVLPALHNINNSKLLSRCVRYIHSDIFKVTPVRFDDRIFAEGVLDSDFGGVTEDGTSLAVGVIEE